MATLTQAICIYLSREHKEFLEECAWLNKKTLSAFVRSLLEEYINETRIVDE